MDRKATLDAEPLAAEGQAQALEHAKDAVDRSAWILARLRQQLSEEPGLRGLRRLELHCALSDLERRQAGLSAAYRKMVDLPSLQETEVLKAFILAYDEFLGAVGAVSRDWRNEGLFCPASKQSPNRVRPQCSLQDADGN